MKDFYELLGLARTATPDEIKKAYRKKAKEHHPDAGGDEKTFKAIQHAYDILSDHEKRERYDRGESTEQGPSRTDVAKQFLYQLFEQCIDKHGFKKDPFKEMRTSIALNMKSLDEAIGVQNNRKKQFEKAGRRVKKGEAYVNLCNAIAISCQQLIDKLTLEKETGDLMIQMLDGSEFQVDVAPQVEEENVYGSFLMYNGEFAR